MKVSKIVLIGFRATGKTSVGKELAQILKWNFLDLDEYIQNKTKKSIKKIVEENGWEYFRKIEKECMKEIIDLSNTVVALGGGAVLHEEEMKQLKKIL